MRKERTLLIIGIWVIILPFLGFPSLWKNVLFVVTGLMITYLAYLFNFEKKSRLSRIENRVKSFVDNISNKINEE